MPKTIKYFNGRILDHDLRDFHGYIAAFSKAEAVRLGKSAFDFFTTSELNNYWSPTWGTAANQKLGEQSESGVWIKDRSDRFFKYERGLV